MKIIKIYTIGGNDMAWRKRIEEICSQGDDKFLFIHPPLYKAELNEKEFAEWNIQQIFTSDIVIVNVEQTDENSVYEIGIINAINTFSSKHIYVIGIGKVSSKLNTHIKSAIFHYESTYENAVDYIRNFLSV